MFENNSDIPNYLPESEQEVTTLAPPPRRPRGPIVFWAAWGAIVVVLAGLLAVVGGGDDQQRAEGDDATSLIELGPAAPRDGADSLGLPVTAEPNQGLVDGQQIAISGSGFPPNTQVGIVQCSPHMLPLEGIARCVTSRFGTATSDDAGNVNATFMVTRMLYFDDREIDCAAPPPYGHPASCTVAVGAMNNYDFSGTAPLQFDSASPIGPSAELEVNLVDDLLDYQPITITIRQPGAGVPWQVSQCVRFRSPNVCVGAVLVGPQDPNSPTIVTSPDGSDIEATVLVSRMIGTEDCAIEPEACSLVIQNSHNGMLRSQRISFRTGMPLAPALLELLAPLPVTEGVWVDLKVVNRVPGQSKFPILQCVASSEGLDDCVSVGELNERSADGSLGQVLLSASISTAQGSVDCSVPGQCVLRYVDFDYSAVELPVVVVPGTGETDGEVVPDVISPETTVVETDTTVTEPTVTDTTITDTTTP